MKHKSDIFILILTVILFLPFTVFNALNSSKAVSLENEKRELSEFPKLTFDSLTDGSFFNGINSYLSDRFVFREQFIDASKKLELLYGITPSGGDSSQAFVYLGGKSDEDEDEDDSVRQSLEQLKLPDLETPETSEAASETITTGPETSESESGSPESEEPDITSAQETTAEPVSEETEPSTVIILSSESDKIGIGSGFTLYASDESGEQLDVKWTFTGGDILQVVLNGKGGVNIIGLKEGDAKVIATAPDGTRATCKLTVYKPDVSESKYSGEADFFPSGLFIYGDGVYVQGGYAERATQNFADIAAYYGKLFKKTDINVLIAPCSAIIIDDPAIASKISNQTKALTNSGFLFDKSINFVNVAETMLEHKNEYVYFKSDHHWTMLGAYYAYCEFAASKGFEPVKLENMNASVLNDTYRGAMYQFTLDERVKNFTDTLIIYTPQKEHSMTVYYATGGFKTYDSCIPTQISRSYTTIIGGDNPYTVINVPENPQDQNILVFKDSFGNAMIPYLVEHYGNIHIVDPRYAEFNITEFFKDQNISDILFLNNIQSVNSSAWARLYLKLVGIE